MARQVRTPGADGGRESCGSGETRRQNGEASHDGVGFSLSFSCVLVLKTLFTDRAASLPSLPLCMPT